MLTSSTALLSEEILDNFSHIAVQVPVGSLVLKYIEKLEQNL